MAMPGCLRHITRSLVWVLAAGYGGVWRNLGGGWVGDTHG